MIFPKSNSHKIQGSSPRKSTYSSSSLSSWRVTIIWGKQTIIIPQRRRKRYRDCKMVSVSSNDTFSSHFNKPTRVTFIRPSTRPLDETESTLVQVLLLLPLLCSVLSPLLNVWWATPVPFYSIHPNQIYNRPERQTETVGTDSVGAQSLFHCSSRLFAYSHPPCLAMFLGKWQMTSNVLQKWLCSARLLATPTSPGKWNKIMGRQYSHGEKE